MTKEEYTLALQELNKKYEIDKAELAKEYAFSNNPYKVGDTVTDHSRTLRIEKIKFTRWSGSDSTPCCVYYGTELKKDGTPAKKQTGLGIYQSNLQNQNQ